MTAFSVWADHKHIQSVDVVLFNSDGSEKDQHALTRGEQTIWHGDCPEAGYGTLYKFRLNGDPEATYPDPRSRFQPTGPDGPSMVIDPSYDWKVNNFHPAPRSKAILYELHIGTFTPEGTYDAAVTKLDALVDLGITHVELLPLAQASGSRNWGYDGVDLFAPNHAYGTPDRLKNFIDECHARGLGVIHDVVYNHFGPEKNFTGAFAPYMATTITDWGVAVNFDQPGSEHVRRFVIDNALMWLDEYRFDGLRLDAVDAIIDTSPQHIIAELTEKVDAFAAANGREIFLFAEFDKNDPTVINPREAGGWGIGTQWVDNFHHALRTVLTGELDGYYQDFGSLQQLGKALSQAIIYEGEYAPYRGHAHGHYYGVMPSNKFLVFSENHDQVGNRPVGDRLAHNLSHDRAKIAPAIFIMSRFIPMLWMGQEWSASTPFQFFSDHQEELVANGATYGRRHQFEKFGWKAEQVPDPQALETFLRSKLDWSEREKGNHADMLDWYKALIRLRKSIPDFGADPHVAVAYDEEAKWLTFTHSGVTVACNFSSDAREIAFDSSLVLSSRSEFDISHGRVVLPGNTVIIGVTPELKANISL